MREIVSPLSGIRSPFGPVTSLLAMYAVLGFKPQLAFDFDDERYFTGSRKSTFSSAITHSRTSNATMVDSDGLLKWAPHNLLLRSEEFDNSYWNWVSGRVITPNAAVAPDGTLSADLFSEDTSTGVHRIGTLGSYIANVEQTTRVYVKPSGRTKFAIHFDNDAQLNATFDLITLTASNLGVNVIDASVTPSVNGWYLCSVTNTTSKSNPYLAFKLLNDAGSSSYEGDGISGVYIWGAHLYRSDLGGMVNNPDRGDSYVSTTSSARYLARRGHHIWNGTAWVNEGLLHESEARTNLLLNSGTLAAQNVTVTAVPHTLHFTGTGTVTLSGASTAGPLVGTGTGENNRVSLTFTPTAGTLTLTVSGTVTNADLEVGSTLSSHKPTAGATVTRAADTLTVPSANLPWPTPNVIGPELVTNGTFDTDLTGWTEWLTPTTSVVSGAAQVIGDAFEGLYQNVSVTAGRVYRITFDIPTKTGAVGYAVYAQTDLGGAALVSNANATTGSFEVLLTATTSVFSIVFWSRAIGVTFTFDNVSVREIDPLAVSIQMQGRMTYADEGTYEVKFYRWQVDPFNRIVGDLNCTSTKTGSFEPYQASSGVADFVVSSPTAYSPGINVPFNIASRHGSTFINGAVDGVALTANTTPVALPDLSATDLQPGFDYMGTIKLFRMWANDLGDTGIAEAST